MAYAPGKALMGHMLLAALVVCLVSRVVQAEETATRAKYNWVMHCQGCHGADAQGAPGGTPAMRGVVARFLQTARGRAFLGRVPGVAFANLSDVETAEVLNWMLEQFDSRHLPRDFIPYTAAEMTALRSQPLIADAHRERSRILRSIARAK
jgi:mono/diheme cytochrome c family protein